MITTRRQVEKAAEGKDLPSKISGRINSIIVIIAIIVIIVIKCVQE